VPKLKILDNSGFFNFDILLDKTNCKIFRQFLGTKIEKFNKIKDF